MKTKGQQCSTTVILNLFQDLSAERDSKGRGKMLKFAIEREHDKKRGIHPWNKNVKICEF
jgi:hypothetical protein